MKKLKKFKIFSIIFCAVLLLLIAFPIIKYFTGYKIYRNISYGESVNNVIDIYIPSSAKNERNSGLVLFIHGGSWMAGDKSEEDARCRLLASHGYVTATLNYTLYSKETPSNYNVFKVLNEIDLALLKVKNFALEKGVNLQKAGISGYSAGAHLAMLYSYSRAKTAPLEIVFTASMAGPAIIEKDVWGIDLTTQIATILSGQAVTSEMVENGTANEILSKISPVSYINENSVKTLIIHGGKDDIVSIKNAQSLIQKLEENGVDYEYFCLENSTHSLAHNPFKHLEFLKSLLSNSKKAF